MDRCADYETLIEQMLADEIDDAGRQQLLLHAQSCAGCRQFVDLHHDLLDPELQFEPPGDAEFDAMRREVLRKIGATAPEATFLERWLGWLRLPLTQPLRAAAMAGVVLALVGSGVMLGRQWQGEIVLVGDVAGLTREASSNLEVSDSEGSQYAYTNVSFSEPREGTLALSFDVTRHMRIERSKDDPLVREILVQSLLNPSPVGTRLEAIRHAGRMIDPKVRQALVLTMLKDPNQAVRTRALEILADHEREPEVQAALLAVLRGEESVQMRLMALDRLAAGGLGRERFDRMMDELDRRDDRALLVRAASYRAGDDR